MSVLHGSDIAKYQGEINFDKLKSVTDFVIIKTSSGCPDPGQTAVRYKDAKFDRNRSEAERVGLLTGFYHYAYPEVSGNTADKEADCFCDNIGSLKPGQLMALDYESAWTGDVVNWCLTFLKRVEERMGIKPLIYLNLSLSKRYNWSTVINNGNGLWLAQWTYKDDGKYDSSQPWPFAAIHQYSNKGSLSGIDGNVDLDIFFGSADGFRKYGKDEINSPPPPPDDLRDAQIDALNQQITNLTALTANFDKANKIAADQFATLSAEIFSLKQQLKDCKTGGTVELSLTQLASMFFKKLLGIK
jgi:GH25 family lysozyme M1 (1,4-beta-N-acetylmuramidase)